jgi:hypothetical protein
MSVYSVAAVEASCRVSACDEVRNRILIGPGQAGSGVEDQAWAGAGKSQLMAAEVDWSYRTEHVTVALSNAIGITGRIPARWLGSKER